jgi:hypothetical protein
MHKPWFDPETGVLLLDEYVVQMPSYRKVMEDQVVTEDELAEHAGLVVDCLKRLDAALPPDTRALATETLCELAVLYALERYHEMSTRG